MEDSHDSRRRMINLFMGGSLGAAFLSIFYPIVRYLRPPDVAEPTTFTVTLPIKATDMKVNSGRIFRFGARPGLLVRTPGGDLKAFSAVCTHLDCTVQYREDRQEIWCACHDGRYDLTGKNVSGPPPRPLDPLEVKLRGDQIVVMRS